MVMISSRDISLWLAVYCGKNSSFINMYFFLITFFDHCICCFSSLTHHSVQLNKLLLHLINFTFVIIIQHLIANNSLHTFLNNFTSTHSNSVYYGLFERAELSAYAYKFLYNSDDASIPRYLRSNIITDYYATRYCIIHFELSKLTSHPVIEFPRFWAC